MRHWKASFYCLVIGIILIPYISFSQYQIPKKMDWWYDARFGMFIHFGSYSYFGHGEWVMFNETWTKEDYQTKITSHFNPENFNAKQIVDIAKTAGMKYIVITAKHHEGFAMWKTNVSGFRDYTGTKIFDLYHYVNFKRDILMELKQECDRQGIKFCLYYSILDWNHSSQTCKNYFSEMKSMTAKAVYVKQMKKQLKELVTLYHPAVLWFDGDWCKDENPPTLFDWWNKKDAEDLYAYIMKLDPTIIVNERVKRDLGLGDFMCPEQKIPPAPLPRQWETCQTMNGCWGYDSRNEESYNSPKVFINELEQIVSRDGNYLLNIGPKGDGSISEHVTSILQECGNWMNIYGESIYGCTRSPFATEPTWGYCTKKTGKLYLHVQKWDSTGVIQIPEITNKISSIYELSQKEKQLAYAKENKAISITLPSTQPNEISSVIVIEYEGELKF
jgi:alpha-L-fucosidase